MFIIKYFQVLSSGLILFMYCSLATAGGSIGINGAACSFNTVASAIAAANSGDTIYIIPSTRIEFIGNISKSLTFVPSDAAAPGNTGCETELLSADSNDVIFDANGFSSSSFGGMGQINNGAIVTFRHMWLRNANADFGGVLSVTEGSELILDDVLVTDGEAAISGGNIYVNDSSRLRLVNDSSVYRGTTQGDGGAIALNSSELVVVNGNVGVSSNNGFSTAAGDGGGVYAFGSIITMSSNQARIVWNQSDQFGGGIYAEESTLNLTDASISNNVTALSGGGVYMVGGSLVMTRGLVDANSTTTFATNQGGGGMALVNGAEADVIQSVISNNTSENGGGGILAREGTVLNVLSNTSVTNNSTSFSGGGLMVWGEGTIDNSDVELNSADRGGGIYCFACTSLAVLNNSKVQQNTAENGGGIYVIDISSDFIVVDDSTISMNQAIDVSANSGYGGGVYISSGDVSISNTVISSNVTSKSGGGVYAEKSSSSHSLSLVMNNVAFNLNQTTEFMTNAGGGGLFVEDADMVSIFGSIFDQNTSLTLGGGLESRSSDQITLDGVTFNQNNSVLGGGAYIANSNDFSVANGQFLNNSSGSGAGGGLYLFAVNKTDVVKSLFDGNAAGSGGGIYVTFSAALNVINSQFENNTAASLGGAISVVNSQVEIGSEYGTGAQQCDPFTLMANSYCSHFHNNRAETAGGAIFMQQSSATLPVSMTVNQSAFTQNSSADNGAAIYLTNVLEQTQVTFNNVLLAENGLVSETTAAIEADSDYTLTMNSVTLADGNGKPLLLTTDLDQVVLNNSIIYGNDEGPLVPFGLSFNRSCNNSQSVSSGGQAMGGSLGDPQFEITTRGAYRLASNSPSINACVEGPSQDLDGLFRPDSNGLYDQGAFERDGFLVDPDFIFINGFDE